jgi:hypothetical protein
MLYGHSKHDQRQHQAAGYNKTDLSARIAAAEAGEAVFIRGNTIYAYWPLDLLTAAFELGTGFFHLVPAPVSGKRGEK